MNRGRTAVNRGPGQTGGRGDNHGKPEERRGVCMSQPDLVPCLLRVAVLCYMYPFGVAFVHCRPSPVASCSAATLFELGVLLSSTVSCLWLCCAMLLPCRASVGRPYKSRGAMSVFSCVPDKCFLILDNPSRTKIQYSYPWARHGGLD